MQRRKKPILMFILVVILALIFPSATFIFANISRNDTNVKMQTSENFYFESSFINANNNRIFAGDVEHRINIDIKNYTDELNINISDINYSVLITTTNTYTDYSISAITGQLLGNTQSCNTLELVCRTGYEDGTQLTVNITSSAPYVKTLTLTITLSTQKVNSYWIEGELNRIYTELCVVVVSNLQFHTLLIEWDNTKIVIDENDEDFLNAENTYTNANGYYKIQLLAPIENSSLKIKFFKKTITQNYSLPITPITDYHIELP